RRETPGKPTKEILPLVFPQLIKSLRFSKSMRWGEGNFYFGRPIHYLLSLFGQEVIKFELAGITSGRRTTGHRYLSPSAFSIRTPQEYFRALRKKWVIIDPARRKALILKQIKRIISSLEKRGHQAKIVEEEELLKEVIYSTEYPTLFLGEFDHCFLSLPSPILRACLRDYQKHFSVRDDNGPLLYFVGVREGNRKHLKKVVEGNQRVVNARLSDAKFFFEEDKKVPLKKRVSSLKEVVVQKKLGSYYDKAMRLVKLGGRLASYLGENSEVKERVERAAYLCKADIVTQVVREFPALQGIMGKEYAIYSQEDSIVAQAILEHKLPRSNNDGLPETIEGAILALTDKIDTLTGSFWAGFIPSGSEDPWGLRREAQGIVEIILDREWKIPLTYLIKEGLKLYGKKEEKEKKNLELRQFFQTRIVNVLKERGLKSDQIRAVERVNPDDIDDVVKRGKALHTLSPRREFKEEVIAIVRLMNILKQAEQWKIKIPGEVKEELLVEKEEKDLYYLWKKIKDETEQLLDKQKYVEAYQHLSLLRDSIHNFFEKVLVMSEDKKLRANRLSLLNKIKDLFICIADFTELQVK
ncbi:MAG: glycine--tRNA ligase subunit beta, partial [Candidatus Aerophobetes bacterium]|nr:glycine--tRNA ligase subunit beta [Candidatus Aerophobetes bacterium]